MSRLNNIRKLLEDFDICYKGYAVNCEEIIVRYLWFLYRSYNKKNHNISIALNSGSPFFDIATIVFAAISALLLNSDEEDLGIYQLNKGALVYIEGEDSKKGKELYLYKGIEQLQIGDLPLTDYVILEKSAKDNYIRKLPKQQWPKIKPYLKNGENAFTASGNIKTKTEKRITNISNLTGTSFTHAAEALCNSVIIVASKQLADDILNNVLIKDIHTEEEYKLLELITASYYTEKEEIRYKGNVEKSEPVLKFTSKLSVARNLIYHPDANEITGLLVLEKDGANQSRTELDELINRRSLGFVFLSFTLNSELAFDLLKEYEDASIFACTREYILEKTTCYGGISNNKYARLFNKRINAILSRQTNAIFMESGINQDEYFTLNKRINQIKNNNLIAENAEPFVIQACSLRNLLITAPFTPLGLERYLKNNSTTASIMPIPERVELLKGYSRNWTGLLKEMAEAVIVGLRTLYDNFKYYSPKRERLYKELSHTPQSQKIAVIIPKAYYEFVIRNEWKHLKENVVFITPNQFDSTVIYDRIIALGNYKGKKFDCFKTISAKEINIYLYDFEKKEYNRRLYWAQKDEKILNSRIGMDAFTEVDDFENDLVKAEELSDIDDILVDESELIDVDVLRAQTLFSDRTYNQITKVVGSGLFADGDFIWFSKNYKATVFDSSSGKVSIIPVEEIQPGNVLIFTKRSSLTKDIVDEILEKLIEEGRVNNNLANSYFKVKHWKAVLREYMRNQDITYEELSKRLSEYGDYKHYTTVRSWIHPFSHIVGPMDIDSYKQIAMLTRDKEMVDNPGAYCKASKIVRDERRLILRVISDAIVKRLGGETSSEDSLFNAVYENMDGLSLQKQIETVTLFESEESAPMGIVNRPISI